MENINDAIERIKILECPTGELEERVIGIFEDYEIAERDEIFIERDEDVGEDEAEYYYVSLPDDQAFTIVAKSAHDDYVVKVIDAYIS